MDQDAKMALWSAVGLAGTLFIAWYFSRRKSSAHATPAASDDTQNANAPAQYTFNIAPVQIPSITPPNLNPPPTTVTPPTAAPTTSTCCKHCADSTAISGGKVLQSGSFSADVFAATHAAVQPTSTVMPSAKTASPTGGLLIRQYNGGGPLPSQSWWNTDAIYRQSFVQAYNNMATTYNAQLQAQHRKGSLRTLSYSKTGVGDYGAVTDQITNDGVAIGSKYGINYGSTAHLAAGDPQELTNDSFMAYVTVLNALKSFMQQSGDPYLSASQGFKSIGVPDQSIITIQ